MKKCITPLWILLYVVLIEVTAASHRVRYDGYKVFRVWPTNEEQIQCLHALSKTGEEFHFWNSVRNVNTSVDIMVPPRRVKQFLYYTESFNLPHELVMVDVQKYIDEQHNIAQSGDEEYGWTEYYRLDAIYGWLDSLVKRFPNIVKPIVVGRSYEGRIIRGVKLTYGFQNPGVVFETGIHAAEWISTATGTYILNRLLTSSDKTIRNIAESHEWFFVPVLNPDGYEYSHTTDRLWRKTRSRTSKSCYGVDPNRNWDINWGGIGSKKDPCDRTFAGWKPFSEIEIKTFSEYLKSIAGRFDTYFSFHSFGQMICFPWGFTEKRVDSYNMLMDIGIQGARTLHRRHGSSYKVGSIINTIYASSGSSVDWVKSELNISFPFVYELRDTGRYGFLLPPDQIIPTGEETMDSVIAILQEIVKYRTMQRF